MSKKENQTYQIMVFIFLSGFAAIANIGSRMILSAYVRFQIAVTSAYLIGMILNFTLNKTFTFPKGPRKAIAELRTFCCIAAFGLLLTNLLAAGFLPAYSMVISASNEFNETIAHISAVCLTGIYSYLGHKYFSYRQGFRREAIELAKSFAGGRQANEHEAITGVCIAHLPIDGKRTGDA